MIRILSIDGGGIRGLIPATVLVTFEHLLKKHSGREDARIADYFDLIAGTSTGGILVAIYLCPDKNNPARAAFQAEDAITLYKENGAKIFHKTFLHSLYALFGLSNARYRAKGIEEVLHYYYGEVKLSELIKPCLISAYDIEKRKAVFFNQADTLKRGKEDFFVKDIIRATTAAPTYFQPAHIISSYQKTYTLIDGGVVANNPALCAYAEATKLPQHSEKEDYMILSLGTGTKQQGYPYRRAKHWGGASWLRPLFSIFQAGVSETVDYQLEIMFRGAHKIEHYLRVQIDFSKQEKTVGPMDNVKPKHLNLLEDIGDRLADQYYDALDLFAEELVSVDKDKA